MAGIYKEGEHKILSGVYSRIVAAVKAVIQGTRGKIAYPFTADWGPVNELVTCTVGEFEKLYHATNVIYGLTAGKIYLHASKGGPSKILGYRMATTDAKVASAEVEEDGMVLQTLYPTTRNFTVIVKDGVVDGTKTLSLVEDGVELFSTTQSTLAAMVADINASDYIRVKTAGSALPSNTAGVQFQNGNNGSSVTASQYSGFLDAMEDDKTANAFSLDGVYDAAIITTVEAWLKRVRMEGFYVTFVKGGPLSWDNAIDDANSASIATNYRGIVNVGNGCDGYTAAEMAIFIAAKVGSVALNTQLTDETVSYAKVNKKLGVSAREKCKTSGTLIFVMNGDYVEIDEGVNTLTSANVEGEVKQFGSIRVNNALDAILTDTEAFGEEYKKGKSNTPESRQAYATAVEEQYFKGLAAQGVIADDYSYQPDDEYHGDNPTYAAMANEAYFVWGAVIVEGMEKIYQKGMVSF